MISNASKQYISELAEFISSEYSEIPIPIDKIAQSEELPIFYDDYGDSFDGLLVFDNQFYIHINTRRGNKEGTPRGRFTLAHELGHYFIDNHRIGLKRGLLQPHGSFTFKGKDETIEREADYFASCLLMPSEKIHQECFKVKFSFGMIKKISSKYNVSLTAAAIRFSEVGNHPIMIVYCEDSEVKWKWYSDDFPFKYLAEKHPKLPEDSIAYEYFQKRSKEKGTEQVWAADWFNCYREEDENRRFYEHLIPFKNKTLSIIWED